MKPLGRKQIRTMKGMLDCGEGYWPSDWRLYSDEKRLLEGLAERKLVSRVSSTPWGRMSSYVVTKAGKDALALRGAIEKDS